MRDGMKRGCHTFVCVYLRACTCVRARGRSACARAYLCVPKCAIHEYTRNSFAAAKCGVHECAERKRDGPRGEPKVVVRAWKNQPPRESGGDKGARDEKEREGDVLGTDVDGGSRKRRRR